MINLTFCQVHIEPENVADVTNRLERILTSTDQLTEVDVEAVAGVISRITVVPVLPVDVSVWGLMGWILEMK